MENGKNKVQAKALLLPIGAHWSNRFSRGVLCFFIDIQLFIVRITLYLVQRRMYHNYLMKMRDKEKKTEQLC